MPHLDGAKITAKGQKNHISRGSGCASLTGDVRYSKVATKLGKATRYDNAFDVLNPHSEPGRYQMYSDDPSSATASYHNTSAIIHGISRDAPDFDG